MDESDFPNREAYVQARLTYLKNKLKDMSGFGCFDATDLDPEMELAFLEQVAAIEAEPTTTYAHQLIGRGICLPPPEDLEEDHLSEKLWEIIHGLAGLRVFLENTGHLNDRELYKQLWKEDLNEFTWDMSHCTNGAMHLDIIGLGENGGSRCLSFGNYLSIGINFLKENILKLCLVGFMVHTGFGCIYPEGAAAGANVDKTVAANDAVGKFLRQALRHFSFTVVE